MKESLKRGLDAEQKKGLETSFKEGLVFRRQLAKWLDNENEKIMKDMLDTELYGKANWGFLQADCLAQIRSNKALKNMLLEKS
jgi:hypothetical protein